MLKAKTPSRPDWSMLRQEGLTLTTFHVGSLQSLSVLKDWVGFFGDSIRKVRVVTCTSIPGCFSREQFIKEFPGGDLIEMESGGRVPAEMNTPGVATAILGAPTTFVAIVKLDTLPYRDSRHCRWLDDAVRTADLHRVWAITAFASHRCRNLSQTFSLTQSFSENFSIVSRAAWRELIDWQQPGLLPTLLQPTTDTKNRFALEAAIENGINKRDWWNLRLVDSREFSIFHINQWEQNLFEIRRRYIARQGVEKFLNGPGPTRKPVWMYPEWIRMYGSKPPSLLRRIRIAAGRWRQKIQ